MEKEIERWMKYSEWKGEVAALVRDLYEDIKEIKKDIKHMEECHMKRLRIIEAEVTNIKVNLAKISAIVTLLVSIGINLLFRVI